jgi:peptide/nickel transport system substrate-binding protein
LAVAGCGLRHTSRVGSRTLEVALAQPPDKLDPTFAGTQGGRTVFTAMCQKLYDLNSSDKVVPQLAAALPRISDHGLTYTIAVRRGARFSDGTPLNAAAVRTSIDHYRNTTGSSREAELVPVKSVTVTGPYEVQIKLKTPYPSLTSILADRSGMVLSPTRLRKLGLDFAQAPSCVGPFKLQSRRSANEIDLVKDPDYYDTKSVKLQKVVYQVISDPNVALANLRSGATDVAEISPIVASTLKRNSVHVLSTVGLGDVHMTINSGNVHGSGEPPGKVHTPLGSDPRIRQALELAINRKQLVRIAFGGLYAPNCSPIPQNSPFSTPQTRRCPPADPAKARALLAAAGVKTPYHVELKTTTLSLDQRLGQVLQPMLAKAGFDLTLRSEDQSTVVADQDAGNFQTSISDWSGRLDPDTNFLQIVGPSNSAGFSDAKINALINQARQTTDVHRRGLIYAKVMARVHQVEPAIVLAQIAETAVSRRGVTGVHIFNDGLIRVDRASITN